MAKKKFDFSGWATKNNLRCSDGLVIRKDAFRDNDGCTVPLVFNHDHNDPNNVLGHALLENREDGVYAYCSFNDTESGKVGKELVKHGDIKSLSIFANKLHKMNDSVVHGDIKEVSLVLAGANPGANIDYVMCHGDDEGEGIIVDYNITGFNISDALSHSELDNEDDDVIEHGDEDNKDANKQEDEDSKKATVQDVINTMNEDQKTVLEYLVGMAGMASDNNDDNNEKGDNNMAHNVFENEELEKGGTLSHSEIETIFRDGKRLGSLKEGVLAHAEEYGIDGIETLAPEPKALNNPPEFISREMGWVQKVMSGVHRTPFSRIKSVFADIREDEARAKGYIKGKYKKEEVFSLLKRTTTPCTVYKKQKLDRDDVLDIQDFNVVAWLKQEMRTMLDEEIARAILVGDGRLVSDDDHINEQNIRPIYHEEELFAVSEAYSVASLTDDAAKAKAFINKVIKSRKHYKGSGNPTCFTTEDVITECLLLEATDGRKLYSSVQELATVLRVKEIVPVEVMEGLSRTVNVNGTDKVCDLQAIIVNLNDYNVGADKGSSSDMFEDFDIDYNQMKYLIETRCSGALVKPFSALIIESYSA